MIALLLAHVCIFDGNALIKCVKQEEYDGTYGGIINGLGHRLRVNYAKFANKILINATVDSVDYLPSESENITILGVGTLTDGAIRCDNCVFLEERFPPKKLVTGKGQKYTNGHLSLESGVLSHAHLHLYENLKNVAKIENSHISTSHKLYGVTEIVNSAMHMFIGVYQATEQVFENVRVENSSMSFVGKHDNRLASAITGKNMDLHLVVILNANSTDGLGELVGQFACETCFVHGNVNILSPKTEFIMFRDTTGLKQVVIEMDVGITQNSTGAESYAMFGSVSSVPVTELVSSLHVISGPLMYRTSKSYFYLFRNGVQDGFKVSSSVLVSYFPDEKDENNELRIVNFGVMPAQAGYSYTKYNSTANFNAVCYDFLNKTTPGYFANVEQDLPFYDWVARTWNNVNNLAGELDNAFSFFNNPSKVEFKLVETPDSTFEPFDSTYERQKDVLLKSCKEPDYFDFMMSECTNLKIQAPEVFETDSKTKVALALMITAIVLFVGSAIFFAFALYKCKHVQSQVVPQERPVSKLNPLRAPSAPPRSEQPQEEKAEVLQVAVHPASVDGQAGSGVMYDYAAEYERLMGK